MSSELNPFDASSWEVCAIHESTYLKDDYCKQCRIEELNKALTNSVHADAFLLKRIEELEAEVESHAQATVRPLSAR